MPSSKGEVTHVHTQCKFQSNEGALTVPEDHFSTTPSAVIRDPPAGFPPFIRLLPLRKVMLNLKRVLIFSDR